MHPHSPCPWCRHPPEGDRHYPSCPSLDPSPPYHGIWPNIFLGSILARADPRFVAVVSILSPAEIEHLGVNLRLPAGAMIHVDHEARTPSLLAKLALAWAFIDHWSARGSVLVLSLEGASRAAAALAGWRIARRGGRLAPSIERIQQARPQALHLWPGYIEELDYLEYCQVRPDT